MIIFGLNRINKIHLCNIVIIGLVLLCINFFIKKSNFLLPHGLGLILGGILTLSINLTLDERKFSHYFCNIPFKTILLDNITSLSYKNNLKTNKFELNINYKINGKEKLYIIHKLTMYDKNKIFLKRIEMYSGKKVKK